MIRNMLFHWTLTRKFLVSILLALLLIFAVMGLIINAHERKVLIDELSGKGDNVARILSAISAEPILSFNFASLENQVRYVGAGDDDILFAIVQDRDEKVLVSYQKAGSEKADSLEFSRPILQ